MLRSYPELGNKAKWWLHVLLVPFWNAVQKAHSRYISLSSKIFLCLTYYLLLISAQTLRYMLTCRFLSSRNTTNFCSVEKIILKVTVLLSYRIWTSFTCNLAILFQHSFLSTYKYLIPQMALWTYFTILLFSALMSKINLWHAFTYICIRVMFFNFSKIILCQQSHVEFPKLEQRSITGQGLYLKCFTGKRSLHSTPGGWKY